MMAEESSDQRLEEIAERLLEQTRSGKVLWSTTGDENAFIFGGSNSSIVVRGVLDQDGDLVVKMKILNPRGTEVGTLGSGWRRSSDAWNVAQAEPLERNALLEALWEASRRSALQIDEVLDSIFDDLS